MGDTNIASHKVIKADGGRPDGMADGGLATGSHEAAAVAYGEDFTHDAASCRCDPA
jgi:hypothetical protein